MHLDQIGALSCVWPDEVAYVLSRAKTDISLILYGVMDYFHITSARTIIHSHKHFITGDSLYGASPFHCSASHVLHDVVEHNGRYYFATHNGLYEWSTGGILRCMHTSPVVCVVAHDTHVYSCGPKGVWRESVKISFKRQRVLTVHGGNIYSGGDNLRKLVGGNWYRVSQLEHWRALTSANKHLYGCTQYHIIAFHNDRIVLMVSADVSAIVVYKGMFYMLTGSNLVCTHHLKHKGRVISEDCKHIQVRDASLYAYIGTGLCIVSVMS